MCFGLKQERVDGEDMWCGMNDGMKPWGISLSSLVEGCPGRNMDKWWWFPHLLRTLSFLLTCHILTQKSLLFLSLQFLLLLFLGIFLNY